jgi:hypothetical protein
MKAKVIKGVASTITLLPNKKAKEITFIVRDNYSFSNIIVLTLKEEGLEELRKIINEILR